MGEISRLLLVQDVADLSPEENSDPSGLGKCRLCFLCDMPWTQAWLLSFVSMNLVLIAGFCSLENLGTMLDASCW